MIIPGEPQPCGFSADDVGMAQGAPAVNARPSTNGLATAVPTSLAEATVLVVDDHESNITLLERVLRGAGITKVHSVMDSRQVVARCLELDPDLVLLDLHMPHMDGYEVLGALRAALPAETFLPVLVLTSDATSDARERALDAGAKDFLTKPFDRVETVQRVRNLLETRELYRVMQRHNQVLRVELDQRTEGDRRHASERRARRTRIEQVLRNRALSMVFQPIVDLHRGAVVGVEALARFDAEPRRPPNEWFDEAADVDLGTALELAAVEAGLAQLDALPPAAFMSVNVSPETATSHDLAELLLGSSCERVVVELTEHTRVTDYGRLLAVLNDLRTHGVRIAVDDAGAGYAGLQHLLRLRPDIIKLDTDLTRDINCDPARRALAGALVSFATEIDALIVAEGIETSDELSALHGLGVPWGQGYHLARPGALPLLARTSVSE
jgi:EAL domain-containing protein (putative c-di-GMP-specific phosphodiesterase class I)/CheY-like chemotaxis protein